jgi:hypothetical protein
MWGNALAFFSSVVTCLFKRTILKIEKNTVTATEVAWEQKNVKQSFDDRRNNKVYSSGS